MTRDATGGVCPACAPAGLELFHAQDGVPTNSCLLVDDEDEALRFPTGSLRLGFCPRCGFIANTAFDPSRAEYSERYEETQAFSPHFREFARDLAGGLGEPARLWPEAPCSRSGAARASSW